MKESRSRIYITLLQCILVSGTVVRAIEPVSTSVLVGAGAVALGKTIYRYLFESCDDTWVHFNATGNVGLIRPWRTICCGQGLVYRNMLLCAISCELLL